MGGKKRVPLIILKGGTRVRSGAQRSGKGNKKERSSNIYINKKNDINEYKIFKNNNII
jgi:hypothetical protein